MLIVPCVLLTGCNSIIFSGNLHVETYEPETLASSAKDVVKAAIQETQKAELDEKYRIEGTNAFYILPGHENRPDRITDFKVLDYLEDYGMIYCYRTPYYGSAVNGESGVTSSAGTAPEEYQALTTTAETPYEVTVLMSYRPDTRSYKVFFSMVRSRLSVSENGIMAHKMVRGHQYFLYVDHVAYLYDADGTQKWTYDYHAVVNQEIDRIVKKHGADKAQVDETVIADVVMDGYGYVYIPVMLQMKTGESEGSLEDISEQDANLENSSIRFVIICCNLDIGTDTNNLSSDSTVLFTSTNENWKKQMDLWKEMDGEIIGDKAAYDAYVENCTMDRIKKGEYKGLDGNTDVRDSYPIFSMSSYKGLPLNMQMTYIPDVLSIDGVDFGSWFSKNIDQLRKWMDEGALPEWLEGPAVLAALMGTLSQEYYWNNFSAAEREQWGNLRKALMVLNEGEPLLGDAVAYRPLSPGAWNNGTNQSPFSTNSYAVESLATYKTTVENNRDLVSRFTDVRIPGRYVSPDASKPYMTVIAYTDPATKVGSAEGGKISRTIKYYEISEESDDSEGGEGEGTSGTSSEESDSDGETGNKVYYEVVTEVDATPMTYALILPEHTEMYWGEARETEDVPVPSGEFGAIYFRDNESQDNQNQIDEKATCAIHYSDGTADLISDGNVPGKAVDAGAYYYGNQEMVVFITSTGVKFYPRTGNQFSETNARYMELDNLTRTTGYSLASLEDIVDTNQIEDDELQEVNQEQEAVIEENLERGKQTEILEASDFAMLNQNEMILSTMYSGLLLCNVQNGLTASLARGSYYASFPEQSNRSGIRKFMVVGYQTDEFSYQAGDIALAKCYEMDLEAESAKLQKESVKEYLDSLVRNYIMITHRVKKTDGVVSKVEPDSAEEEDCVKARRLFLMDDGTAGQELNGLMAKLGFGNPDQELLDYLEKLRKLFQDQRAALMVLYQLSGVGTITELPEDMELLILEGQLVQAGYADNLERTLVELALTDRAIEAMPVERQQEYREYQRQMKAIELSGKNMGVMDQILSNQGGTSQSMTGSAAGKAEEAGNTIQEASFYQKVLDGLKERFESGSYASREGQSWDAFIKEKLKQVSPYRSIDPKEQGLELFRRATGMTEELYPDSEGLLYDISSISNIRDLEELIVRYKVERPPAAYQSRGYQEEFEAYQKKPFASSKEQRAAFLTSKFYQIIKDLQEEDAGMLEELDMSWEELLDDILKRCGMGVVVPVSDDR